MFLNDSESHIDLLNFQTTADSVASVILTNGDEPVSIGVFGDWGSGKSSLVRMIGEALSQRAGGEKLVFVEFNAWLYQGFDDAKMALLQCVSDRLIELSAKDATLAEKVCGFLRRIDVLRAAKIVLPLASSVLAGNAIGGPCGGIVGLATSVKSTGLAGLFKDAPAVIEAGEAALSASKSCIRPEAARSLPKEIADMRKSFEDILASAKVRLVVLVDDLDRCLPETAIETLEAMRLLLFTRNTIFIIAADEVAIRKAVSNRYASEDVEGKLTTSYFDKLIQIPLAVPHPSHNEIRFYLTALMAETACLAGRITRDELLNGCGKMSEILKSSWRGKVRTRDVDAAFGNAAMKIRGEIEDKLQKWMDGIISEGKVLNEIKCEPDFWTAMKTASGHEKMSDEDFKKLFNEKAKLYDDGDLHDKNEGTVNGKSSIIIAFEDMAYDVNFTVGKLEKDKKRDLKFGIANKRPQAEIGNVSEVQMHTEGDVYDSMTYELARSKGLYREADLRTQAFKEIFKNDASFQMNNFYMSRKGQRILSEGGAVESTIMPQDGSFRVRNPKTGDMFVFNITGQSDFTVELYKNTTDFNITSKHRRTCNWKYDKTKGCTVANLYPNAFKSLEESELFNCGEIRQYLHLSGADELRQFAGWREKADVGYSQVNEEGKERVQRMK